MPVHTLTERPKLDSFFFNFLFLIDFFWSSFRSKAKLRGSTKLPIHSLPRRAQPPPPPQKWCISKVISLQLIKMKKKKWCNYN